MVVDLRSKSSRSILVVLINEAPCEHVKAYRRLFHKPLILKRSPSYTGEEEWKMKSKVITGIMLTLLLVNMLTLVFNVQQVKASGTIYIRADGSVDPSTTPIHQDGDIYTFTDNIYGEIVVQRDNITVDGVGYTLKGMGSGVGIALTSRSNVTIKNLGVRAFKDGIYLDESSNFNSILGNEIANNGVGLSLYSSSNNKIFENSIANNDYGILLMNSSGNILRSNNMTDNVGNFGVGGSLSNPSLLGFVNDVDSSNTVDSKPIYYWVGKGDITVPTNGGNVVLVNCTRITVENLNLANNWQGLLLAYSTNSIISGNNITKNRIGIDLVSSSNNNISQNNITKNDYGISLHNASNNRISENNLTFNNSTAISLSDLRTAQSNHNIISGNNITNSNNGVILHHSSSNVISGNKIIASNYNGITLWRSSNNIISNNIIQNNEQGILFSDSSANTIYHNNFVENADQASNDGSMNVWDDGYPSGGNYWSDYPGVDADGDGIGDTPYIIDASAYVESWLEEGVYVHYNINSLWGGDYGWEITSVTNGVAAVEETYDFGSLGIYHVQETINIDTREITSSNYPFSEREGTKTAFWINPDIQLGQTVSIWEFLFQVSHTDFVDTSQGQIECWVLTSSAPELQECWYDKFTGVNLKMVTDEGNVLIEESNIQLGSTQQDSYPLMNPWSLPTRKVGVSVGDWVRFGIIEVDWNYSYPLPADDDILGLNETLWMKLTVDKIDGLNVTYTDLKRYKNGTEYSRTGWMDVDTGEGWLQDRPTAGMFISANLTEGENIYSEAPPWKYCQINETRHIEYANAIREASIVNITQRCPSDEFSLYYNRTSIYIWDKLTGVLCKADYYYVRDGNIIGSASVEIDETNLWGPVARAPDLVISDVFWNPSEPSEGESVLFSYVIKNKGSEATALFTTALYIDDERIDISARTSLAAGETQTRSFTYAWTATEGTHEIRVVADDLYEIDESDEMDNEMAKLLEVIVPELISFDVLYEDDFYKVSLWVLPSYYADMVRNADNAHTLFPNVDRSTLAGAYYLTNHVENPNEFRVLEVTIVRNGEPVLDAELKTTILDGLLKYCYELIRFTNIDQLDEYITSGVHWIEEYGRTAPTVAISDFVSDLSHLATIIGPLFDSIDNLLGKEASSQVKGVVKLFFCIVSGPEEVIDTYGAEATNQIVETFIRHGLISSENYNGIMLYKLIQANPSKFLEALKEIDSEVLGYKLNSDAESLVSSFITHIGEGVIKEFSVGAALGLYAYFGSGVPVQTAVHIGLKSVFKGFTKVTLHLAIAQAISESYNLPMANALHEAWEDMRYMSRMYVKMFFHAHAIANPKDGTLNLTNSDVLASLYGLLCLTEYHFYMTSYFYESNHFIENFLSPNESELNSLKSHAEKVFSDAEEWANVLENIYDYAEAIVLSVDPEGSNFNFTLSPPINVLPIMPENASGFVLIVNSTSNILLKQDSYVFSVQNRTWLSNFTYSFYVDDANGTAYLILCNPPEGQYQVETQNETQMILTNFESSNGNITLSRIEEVFSTELQFNVAESAVVPKEGIPWWILGVVAVVMVGVGATLVFWKRRKPTS